MNKKIIPIVVIGTAVAVTALWYAPSNRAVPVDQVQKKWTIRAATTFFAIDEIVRAVGRERIAVVNLAPADVDAHDFEPSPRDVTTILSSDVFFYHGGGLDPWAERIAENARGRDVTTIAVAASLVDDLSEGDPHVWLDPVRMRTMVATVRDALIAADPDGALSYTANASNYTTALETLDREFTAGLASCALKDAIVAHDAYRYLAERYGFTTHAITGAAHESEPTPRRLAALATLAREKGMRIVFAENLLDTRVAEALAREVGAKTLLLHPLEGLMRDEQAHGATYLSLMQQNLTNLRIALDCR